MEPRCVGPCRRAKLPDGVVHALVEIEALAQPGSRWIRPVICAGGRDERERLRRAQRGTGRRSFESLRYGSWNSKTPSVPRAGLVNHAADRAAEPGVTDYRSRPAGRATAWPAWDCDSIAIPCAIHGQFGRGRPRCGPPGGSHDRSSQASTHVIVSTCPVRALLIAAAPVGRDEGRGHRGEIQPSYDVSGQARGRRRDQQGADRASRDDDVSRSLGRPVMGASLGDHSVASRARTDHGWRMGLRWNRNPMPWQLRRDLQAGTYNR